jgi:N-acetylmuramoyl-L-alanine amidase
MNRRLFIKKIPALGFLFYQIKNGFAKTTPRLIAPVFNAFDISSFTVSFEDQPAMQIQILWKNGLAYISARKFAESLKYHTYFNDTKKKIVLYLPQNQVVVTANNVFIIVDEEIYQMPAPALWQGNEILLPVKYFVPLLNKRTTLNLDYDEPNQKVQITSKKYNIADVIISEKENGTVIHIKTLKYFKPEEVTADMRYGWLHVDLYSGKANEDKILKAKSAGLVRNIKIFQFAELASLAFQLRKEPLSKEIISREGENEVIVVLRTREEIGDSDLSEEKSEDSEEFEPSEDIKKQLEEERRKWLIDVVVIDAGHGGKDPGTIGIGKVKEKDIVLSIAQKLGKIVEKELPEVKVVYTRSSDNFVSLKKRTQIANENNGKVFISIHANSNKSKRASGFETYILGPEKGEQARSVVLKENSVIDFEDASTRDEYKGINTILSTMAQNAFSRQSEYLASLVQQELDRNLGSLKIENRGVKQGPFWVMVGATMPNILVETGFLSNSYDVKILKTSAYQYKFAQGIFDGLKRFKQDYENTI